MRFYLEAFFILVNIFMSVLDSSRTHTFPTKNITNVTYGNSCRSRILVEPVGSVRDNKAFIDLVITVDGDSVKVILFLLIYIVNKHDCESWNVIFGAVV